MSTQSVIKIAHFQPFNPTTGKMDPELKKSWLHFMVNYPEKYLAGCLYRPDTGCMCALGCLLHVIGALDSHWVTRPKTDFDIDIPEAEKKVARYTLIRHFIGPNYERVYALSDDSKSYHSAVVWISHNL